MLKYKIIIFVVFALAWHVNAQNGFDSYLAKDTTYRFNSALRILDSLLVNSGDYSRLDTLFSKTFAKA
ncbi:MAG TPA: hypothetical protein VGK25_01990, partial [Ignavibacteria bacterium]